MIKLSKSQKSPFDKGIWKNLSYTFSFKKYIDKDPIYIDWKMEIGR
jgi:hypothetical protein